jgi:hypothetical protein
MLTVTATREDSHHWRSPRIQVKKIQKTQGNRAERTQYTEFDTEMYLKGSGDLKSTETGHAATGFALTGQSWRARGYYGYMSVS